MMNFDFYREELYQMRKNYKNNPLDNINLKCPEWIDSNDPIAMIYSDKSNILKQGEIIYASIVQANNFLFRSFPPFDCPAQIVYSKDSYIAEKPESLFKIAFELYNYKGMPEEEIPEKWREIANSITDEYDRTNFAFSIDSNGQEIEYNMITAMVYRKLLPKRKLCGNLIPVLTVPQSKQVLILPKKYWTKKFTKAWVEGNI